MRCVVQRVSSASVEVEGELIAAIGRGLMVLVGVEETDDENDVAYMAKKLPHLRIFEDAEEKMNRSVLDEGGEVLLISQFTLYGDARHGRRPSFIAAARPEKANALYEALAEALRAEGLIVKNGKFQATMSVALVNEGPVTILLESRKLF